MTTGLPWSPRSEPTREECEALIGRRARVVHGGVPIVTRQDYESETARRLARTKED